MSEYPVQFEKVQAPPLRVETLARPRLLDWLSVKIHRRVVLVLAEAGYGKTTLLADFTRRSRIPVAWYRLDRGDRDWLGFLAHLVAAFRVHRPDFAPVTQAMIRDASMGTSTRDMVLEAFIRELGTLAAEPASIVLDDFHLVDDSEDARAVVRALLARAPERLTFVLISRTIPSLPLARLRALGEVAELETADLRFAPDETHQLFRDTYAMDLEPGIVAELSRRTEGWVASLQLVRAAIKDRNRSEIRAFVRSLSGAEGNLYDYLAEEVVGELSADLQQFLMRTSLLEVIEPVLAAVAATAPAGQTKSSIAEGEMLGLFSRIGPNTRDHVRAHPLVRDFLQARLLRSIGRDAVIEIHRAIAVAAESLDWRIAGHHYLEAGDLEDARRVLAGAIEAILATGAYSAAEELVTALPATDEPDPNVLVILSRLAQQRGQLAAGRELAQTAYDTDWNNAAAALNLQSALMNSGEIDEALKVAGIVEMRSDWIAPSLIGRATRLMLETSKIGRLDDSITANLAVIQHFAHLGQSHYAGVAHLGLGYLMLAKADAPAALGHADESISHLAATSAGQELVSAHLLRGTVLAFMGDLAEARREMAEAASRATSGQSLEVAVETAAMEAFYGDTSRAAGLLAPYLDALDPDRDVSEQGILALAVAVGAQGRLEEAERLASQLRFGTSRSTVAMEAQRGAVRASVGLSSGDLSAHEWAVAAREVARTQGADLWVAVAGVLASAPDPIAFGRTIEGLASSLPVVLTLTCDTIGGRWDSLSQTTVRMLEAEVRRRRERWLPVLRQALTTTSTGGQLAVAAILEDVGERADVVALRRLSHQMKGLAGTRDLGRGLARKLAVPIAISDLGRLEISVGERCVDGSQIRRKVLALLCFLISRPNMSATREEALEALWPDLDPSTALNSLNQTVYFLRRVFEPDFVEETSPGYIGQDGEIIWLDPGLVTVRSRQARELMRRATPGKDDPETVFALASMYKGRFAINFTYEDWAADYRNALHASYLRIVEAAIRSDASSGHYDRGIVIAQMAAEVEPDADEIQIGLLRLLRLSGATAAAAEHYEHYARTQRALGAEPEPFEQLTRNREDR